MTYRPEVPTATVETSDLLVTVISLALWPFGLDNPSFALAPTWQDMSLTLRATFWCIFAWGTLGLHVDNIDSQWMQRVRMRKNLHEGSHVLNSPISTLLVTTKPEVGVAQPLIENGSATHVPTPDVRGSHVRFAPFYSVCHSGVNLPQSPLCSWSNSTSVNTLHARGPGSRPTIV